MRDADSGRWGAKRKALWVAGGIVAAALLGLFAPAAYHVYERNHTRFIYLDDISMYRQPDGTITSGRDIQKEMEDKAISDAFSAAFAEEPNCSALTLVRYSATRREWNGPYAYWFLSFDSTNGNSERPLTWHMDLTVGNEPPRSNLSETSNTPKEAASKVCLIAKQSAGTVW
jgi:hypothetical protein